MINRLGNWYSDTRASVSSKSCTGEDERKRRKEKEGGREGECAVHACVCIAYLTCTAHAYVIKSLTDVQLSLMFACVHVCCACVHVCMCGCVHVWMCACVDVCVSTLTSGVSVGKPQIISVAMVLPGTLQCKESACAHTNI